MVKRCVPLDAAEKRGRNIEAALAALFALALPFRNPGMAEFSINNAVFTFGDQFIEVISPVQADTACGRHLARRATKTTRCCCKPTI